MGMPTIKTRRGRTKTNSDPNQLHITSFGGTPRSIIRKQGRKRIKSDIELEIQGWLGLIFIMIPMFLFFLWLFPKFFILLSVFIFIIWLLIKLDKKVS